jgi:capsular exopolysaccharide synthesis family protein
MTAVACAIAYYHTEQLQRVYEADCTIEYDPNPIRPWGNDIEDVTMPYHYWASRELFATQNEIIQSRAVAERVVRNLGLEHDPGFMGVPPEHRAGWSGGSVTQAAKMLQGKIRVEQERDTRLVHVRVLDTNPERARLLANAVAESFIDKTLEDRMGSSANALEWLSQQLDSVQKQLEGSELKLHEFVEDEANLSMPFGEQQKLISSEIQSFSSKLTEAQIRRIELKAYLKELEAAIGADPVDINYRVVSASETVASMRQSYLDMSREREALALKYGPEHPSIKSLDVQLARTLEQLRTEIGALLDAARSELREIETVQAGLHSALDRANEAGLSLSLKEITHRRLERERDNAARLYGTLLERTAETDLTNALRLSFARVVDPALKPTFAVYPSYRKNLVIGGVIGLMLGVAMALLLSLLDRVIRTVEDAEALGLTMLGVVPRIVQGAAAAGPGYGRKRRGKSAEPVTNRDMIVHTHPKSSVAECARTVRTNLTFMSAEHPQRALVTTSASPKEGKSTVSVSLGISLAQSGKRVLLVDTDLRKPRLHKALGLSNARGVTTVLVGELALDQAIARTDVPGLELMPSGPIPPNPAELLHTPAFGKLVEELKRRYDLVIFDSPPLGVVTDAAVIAPQVDGVLMVVHSQKTTRDALRSALRQLGDVNAHITGGVLNDVDLSSRQYGYGGYYYYASEGYAADDDDRSRDVPAAED